MTIRVAVVGGGPSGSSAAEVLAKAGIETYLFERKLDNAKPCGGAIPLCMVSEFDLPPEIIDRRVRKMKMISPSNIEVNIGQTLKDDEVLGWVIDLHYIDDLVLVGNFEWKVDFAQFTIQLFEF